MKEIEIKFKNNEIQPTATRLLVMEAIEKQDHPVSLNELENLLDTVDKSTIFRALCLFTEKGLIHEIEDGSGCRKYCKCSHNDALSEMSYVHFTCIKCHQTECLSKVKFPAIKIPNNYSIVEQSFLIKGICPTCQHLIKKE